MQTSDVELTNEEWREAQKLLTLSSGQLHKMQLDELRTAANFLRGVSDLCRYRSRALHKLCEAREGIGDVD